MLSKLLLLLAFGVANVTLAQVDTVRVVPSKDSVAQGPFIYAQPYQDPYPPPSLGWMVLGGSAGFAVPWVIVKGWKAPKDLKTLDERESYDRGLRLLLPNAISSLAVNFIGRLTSHPQVSYWAAALGGLAGWMIDYGAIPAKTNPTISYIMMSCAPTISTILFYELIRNLTILLEPPE